ncbi:putative ribonuclease H protein, partial [Mucuna pruriens]
MNIINNCLDVFFSSFGQKVVVVKTQLLVSRNSYGIKLHFIVSISKETYAYLLEKAQRCLSNLRANSLSFTRRYTLAKVIVGDLLTYTMKIIFLPKQVCDKLESMNKSFVWGELQNCRRCHTISWNKFCLSKDVGGMDFRDLHFFNYAFIIKLGCGLITNLDALQVCVLQSKYEFIDQFIASVYRIDHGSEVRRDRLLVMEAKSGFGGIVGYFQGHNLPSNAVEFCAMDCILAEREWDIERFQ